MSSFKVTNLPDAKPFPVPVRMVFLPPTPVRMHGLTMDGTWRLDISLHAVAPSVPSLRLFGSRGQLTDLLVCRLTGPWYADRRRYQTCSANLPNSCPSRHPVGPPSDRSLCGPWPSERTSILTPPGMMNRGRMMWLMSRRRHQSNTLDFNISRPHDECPQRHANRTWHALYITLPPSINKQDLQTP